MCHGCTGPHSLSLHPTHPQRAQRGHSITPVRHYIRSCTFSSMSVMLGCDSLLLMLSHSVWRWDPGAVSSPLSWLLTHMWDSTWQSCSTDASVSETVFATESQPLLHSLFPRTSTVGLWQRRWWWEICVFLLIVGVFFFPLPHIFWESLQY